MVYAKLASGSESNASSGQRSFVRSLRGLSYCSDVCPLLVLAFASFWRHIVSDFCLDPRTSHIRRPVVPTRGLPDCQREQSVPIVIWWPWNVVDGFSTSIIILCCRCDVWHTRLCVRCAFPSFLLLKSLRPLDYAAAVGRTLTKTTIPSKGCLLWLQFDRFSTNLLYNRYSWKLLPNNIK